MAGSLKRAGLYLVTRWERLLFSLVGFACLGFTFDKLIHSQVPQASAVFAMAVFSFFYSNLARFRRFKGLGFEAELWEDKQKEAASLIDRLKNVVTIYTRETVMGTVMRGRLGGGERWDRRWQLFGELEAQHRSLGQEIDFSDLRHEVESAFIFDICSPLGGSVRKAIEKAKAEVSAQLQQKYGSPITDNAGFNQDHARLREVRSDLGDDLFERAKSENIARSILEIAEQAQDRLGSAFHHTPQYNETVMARLRAMADLAEKRPLTVTPTLLEWAHDRSFDV